MLLAFDSLEEMERIDGLVARYDAVLMPMRTRMEAEDLNRDYSRVVEALRYDPDGVKPSEWSREEVMNAAEEIMKRFSWRQTTPPVS